MKELGRVRNATGFRLIGYVVMPEHVHLLISEPREGTPSTVLHKLNLSVARKLRKGSERALGSCDCRLRRRVSRCERSGRRAFYFGGAKPLLPMDV